MKTSAVVYKKAYEDWLNGLSEVDREFEAARMKQATKKPASGKVSKKYESGSVQVRLDDVASASY